MKKYEVISFSNTHSPESRYNKAFLLKEQFGLPYSVEEIYMRWTQYCIERYGDMNWDSDPDKEEVESVFGVILMEIK